MEVDEIQDWSDGTASNIQKKESDCEITVSAPSVRSATACIHY